MFAQSERVRRWVARNGHNLVALCQDTAGTRQSVAGFRALIGIARRGQADLVILPGLANLSADKIVQEIMLMHLRSFDLAVASTEEADRDELADPAIDPSRMFVRDILYRLEEYETLVASETSGSLVAVAPTPIEPTQSESDVDVLIEFVDAPTITAVS